VGIETHTDANLHAIIYDGRAGQGIMMGNDILLYFQEEPGLPTLAKMEGLACKDFSKPRRRWRVWGEAVVAQAREVNKVCVEHQSKGK
jgi:hypothetical protein